MLPLGDPFGRILADPVSAAIGVGGSIISGFLGSSAASKAAQQQQQAQQQVINTTNQVVGTGQNTVATGTTNANQILSQSANTQLGMYSPYIQAGQGTLGQLAAAGGPGGQLAQQFSFDPSNLSSDPGYQFTLQQGQQAIQRAAAAQGGLFSSGTLKSLAGYTTGTANQYFNDAYNRAASTFNINRQGALSQISTLQNLAQLGAGATQAGAGAVGSTSQQQAQNSFGQGTFNANLGLQGQQIIGGALTNQGNAAAAGTIGQANAWSGALGGATNQISNYLGLKGLANYLGQPTGGGGGTPAGFTPYSSGGAFTIPGTQGGGLGPTVSGGGGYSLPTSLSGIANYQPVNTNFDPSAVGQPGGGP